MLNKIIDFSAKNRYLVIVLFVVALFFSFKIFKNIPVDAIPDLSETQVIIYAKWNKNPKVIEDQITYPIMSSLLGAPKVKAIRGFSDYGYSFTYVIFKDGTDMYWARSRVLEYLDKIKSSLPQDAKIGLGPDATGVGWVYQYVIVDKSGKRNIDEIRGFNDFNIKYQLNSVEGVSEVATIGGFLKEYQILINPHKLFYYQISIEDIIRTVRENNNESDARLIEYSGFEYMIRVKGYIKGIEDIKKISIKSSNGVPVFLGDVCEIKVGPQIRRGLGDLNGEGDAVSGIIVARHKENALKVIEKVKEKIEEIRKTLPKDIEIISVYDRSMLIKRAIDTLKRQLVEEVLIVSFIILLFLWHIPSAIVAILTIPVSIGLCLILMYILGIDSNIMSISGIAISIGVLVDGAIIEVENAYKKLEIWQKNGRNGDFHEIRLSAIKEVVPSVFFSLLVIAVSFLPIFALTDMEGRLFSPLAYTKTLTMLSAAFLALTLDPALRMSFSRVDYFRIKPKIFSSLLDIIFVGKYYSEERHPISRVLFKIYTPICHLVLRKPKLFIFLAIVLTISTIPFFLNKIGSEYMPPLEEGSVLYMPTTFPSLSISEASRILQISDKIIKTFPEVKTVYGKAGRADTSTDPAPLSMFETVIELKPHDQWREKKRWYSNWAPEFLKKILRHIWYDRIAYDELIREMNEAVKIPGFANAWTMPIKGRIDMITTGVRTPIGIKVMSGDLSETEMIGVEIEKILKDFKGIRSVYAERAGKGYYVEIEPDREKLARYGLSIEKFQEIVSNTIGAMPITYTIEGRERYPITLRYQKKFRATAEDIKNTWITVSSGIHILLSEIASVKFNYGPSMIRNENGFAASYVYIDTDANDIGKYVEELKEYIYKNVNLPPGSWISFSGQYENMIRVRERMKIVVPLVILLIFLLLYANTKSYFKTLLVMSAIPFSLIGCFAILYFLDYNFSIAVLVGIIALAGLDAETAVFMLLYLELSYNNLKNTKDRITDDELKDAIFHGAVKRVRPKMMTVSAAFMGLIPIMWSLGTGSDLMKRIAAPMIGGLFTSYILELLIYPAVYYLYIKKKEGL